MAVTQISDLAIDDKLVTENIILTSVATNAFLNSGVMVRDPLLDEFLNGPLGGKTIAPRFFSPIPDDDPNISSDDPSVKSTPAKLTGGENQAVRQSLNKSWSSMDLAASLAGADPLQAVVNQIAGYWNGVYNKRAIASVQGVINADIATGSPTMSVDITGETGAAALFNGDAFIDTVGTLGDRLSLIEAIAMHSVVYNTMLKEDLIEFIRDSEGRTVIPYYMGKRVILDDALTVVESTQTISLQAEGDEQGGGSQTPSTPTTTTTKSYYTYLFGPGALAFGLGSPKVPFENKRDADAGNGGGQETVYSRVETVIHPQGFSFAKTTTPTMAQLVDGSNWTRNYERKRIALACLISKG